MASNPITDPAVAGFYDRLTPALRQRLLAVRDAVLTTPDLIETLKWGEPSYRPAGNGKAVRTTTQVAISCCCSTAVPQS